MMTTFDHQPELFF